MVTIEAVAEAALNHEALQLRSLAQDFLAENPDLAAIARPGTANPVVLAAAAGLVELFALRKNQAPPTWTESVPAVDHSIYLLASVATMKRLRTLCDAESPEPLRRRGIYAPPNFLEFA